MGLHTNFLLFDPRPDLYVFHGGLSLYAFSAEEAIREAFSVTPSAMVLSSTTLEDNFRQVMPGMYELKPPMFDEPRKISLATKVMVPLSAAPMGLYEGYKSPPQYRREDAKLGRNEPCHCGSGKKYKNCCLKQ